MTDGGARRRNGVLLVGGAVALLLVAVGAGIYLLSDRVGADPGATAEEFAELYQRGLNSSGRDVRADEFEPVVCAADMPRIREAFSATENPVDGAPRFRLSVKDVRTEGDTGTFAVTSEITVPGAERQSADETFRLVREGGDWRVCGLDG